MRTHPSSLLRKLYRFCLTVALTISAVSHAEEKHFDSAKQAWSAAESELTSSSVADLSQAIDEESDVRGIGQRLDWAIKHSTYSAPALELQLLLLVDNLRRASLDNQHAEAALAWLARYRTRVLVPHDEGREGVLTAAFPVATRAAGALNELAYERQFEATTIALADGTVPAGIAHYGELSAAQRYGLLSALRNSAKTRLVHLRSQLAGTPAQPAVIAILAEELSDVALYRTVLVEADNATRARLLGRVHRRLTKDQAYEVLHRALSSPAAGIAVASLGQMVSSTPKAKERLFQLLDDDMLGGAAALALARTADETIIGNLEEQLRNSKSTRERGHVLLALKLTTSEKADAVLHAFVARTPDNDSQVRQVKQWLR